MGRKSIPLRMPRSLWLQFSLLLRREGRSVQNWVECAIDDAIAAGGRRNVAVTSPGIDVARQRPAALKRLGAVIEESKLERIRSVLRESGLSREQWLLLKIGQFVAENPLNLTDLLPTRVNALVNKWLPDDPDARREILLAIADWDEAVILDAATDSTYGLRQAVRGKDPKRLSAILAVAAKGLEFRRERTALRR
jgi:hypothetical protein